MTEAYVTLVATDAYASGALVLSHKLRELGSEKEIVCLVTPNITDRVKDILSKVCVVIPVDTIRSTDFDNLNLLGRPELDITFTKFHLWRLTQYSKIVYLDADTYPLKNIDELFDWPSFSAAPDAGWPDCFNSGVFVTEPSEAIFNDLTALASEKGSFDGGDQGLLNSYFSSWSKSPAQRLPFTFNTTPTAQYGYAPAHNQFGHSISILHFIGQNKPWKYQRFADGRILPLGGNAWEGLRDMVQEWWNTWDKHFGRTPPYHLLSGEFDHLLGFDSGFQTRPIVPFDEPVKNAWDDQKIDFHDERRYVQPMPPISTISIKHPEWIKQYDVQEKHEPYYQTQPESQSFEQQQHREHHQKHHHERHNDESHGGESGGNNHNSEAHSHEDQPRNHEHHHDHHHENQHNDFEKDRHQEQHEHQHAEQNDFHNEDQQKESGENHQQGDEQHHREHHKEEKTYSMIEWNPAYQDPPKTGNLGADIPDLSYFKNVWDQPHVEQHRRLWVAPVHQPEPEIMKKPEYSNYDTEEYDSEILYPRETQKVDEEQHLEVCDQKDYFEDHQQEGHYEEPHHHEEHHHREEYHHQEEHYHQEEHHQQEPIYPPAFPWDNIPDHFPPPTRVWLDEQHYQQDEEVTVSDHHEEQQKQEPHRHEESHIDESRSHESSVHEESYDHEESRNEHEEVDSNVQHQVHTHSHPNLHIDIDHHDGKDSQTETVVESITNVELETKGILPEIAEKESEAQDSPNNQQALFAIDQVLTPSAQIKIDEFIAALAADDHDGLDYSDRDLIPINFKSSSRLSGMYTPSPAGSRVVSRNASRNNSRSNSRRASVVSSRRNSISVVKKPATVIDITPNVPIEQDVEQSSKLFAGESSIFSRKTPYTSAAVTPAAIATPEELDRDTYFNDESVDVDQIVEGEGEDSTKPDFLETTQYSLNDSLELEGEAEIDDWDPMQALNKLRELSESMVLRQSLHEALIKTAQEQEQESEFLELANEPVITQPKRPTFFKSSWDDEEYELPSGVVSGQSTPRTPVVRSLSSNLTAEIEMEKERHKQQRASLMLAQPQAAVASMLEAELDLSQGTLFKRRHYESSDAGTDSISSPSETVGVLTTEEVIDEEDKTAYYDVSVIKEAQRKLMALISGEDDKEETKLRQADPIPQPISKEIKQTLSGTTQISTESTTFNKPASFADFMLSRKSNYSNFGFDDTFKSPTYQFKRMSADSIEIPSPVNDEFDIKKDPSEENLQVIEEAEKATIEEDLEEKQAVAAAIALLSGVEETTHSAVINKRSDVSPDVDQGLEKPIIVEEQKVVSDSDSLVVEEPLADSESPISERSDKKDSILSTEIKAVEENTVPQQNMEPDTKELIHTQEKVECSSDEASENVISILKEPLIVPGAEAKPEETDNDTKEIKSKEDGVKSDDADTSSVVNELFTSKITTNTQDEEAKDTPSTTAVGSIDPTVLKSEVLSAEGEKPPSTMDTNYIKPLSEKIPIDEESTVCKDDHNIVGELTSDVANETLPLDKSSDSLSKVVDAAQISSDITVETAPTDEPSGPTHKENDIVKQSGINSISPELVVKEEDFVVCNEVTISSIISANVISVSKNDLEVEDTVLADDGSKVDKSIAIDGNTEESFAQIIHDSENSATATATSKVLPSKPFDINVTAKNTETSAPHSTTRSDSPTTTTSEKCSETSSKKESEKSASSVKTLVEKKPVKNSNEIARDEKKQGGLKNVGSVTSRAAIDNKEKESSSKGPKAREGTKAEKSLPDTKVHTNKTANKLPSTNKTLSKRSSAPVLKPLPPKPVSANVKNDKTTKTASSTQNPATKTTIDSRNVNAQKPNPNITHTTRDTNTRTLRNRKSAPALNLSQRDPASSKASTIESKPSKPGTPTRAVFSARSATPPSPPPKTTAQSRTTSSGKQTPVARSPVEKNPPSPVKPTFATARQPSPTKATITTARQPSPTKPTFTTARQPSPTKPTFTTARQPSPTKPTFASKAAFAIKSVTGNKPLTPSRKELPPRVSSGPSKVAVKKKSPVLPVRSNSKSSIATPITSATSVVSEEPVLAKSLPDSTLILSEKSIVSKRKNSNKGKERVSPTSSVISIPTTPKPKPDTITSPKAHLVDHHHSKHDHSIKAISKQLPIVSTRKDTYASVTKSHATLGEHHHTNSNDDHHHHHKHPIVKDQINEQSTQNHHSSVGPTASLLSRQSSASSTSFTINETASIAPVTSSSKKSLSFTRRSSSSSSIAATNVATATGTTVSPTESTSSSRKSARERISSFVKGSAFKKTKKTPEEK